MKTWHKELIVVVLILLGVWIYTGYKGIEALGSVAVIFTFCHAQVAFRLEEKQGDPGNPNTVNCYKWQSRYFCAKEVCWLAYFVILGAWSALVGVFVFLAYPFWRKCWTKHTKKRKPDLQAFNDTLEEWGR